MNGTFFFSMQSCFGNPELLGSILEFVKGQKMDSDLNPDSPSLEYE